MVVERTTAEYRQQEREIYDKIREASEAFARLSAGGQDTTEALRQLEAALVEFEIFRCNGRSTKKECRQ